VRRPIILILALVFALALLARAVTYTVRFTEAGVLTTFGKAVETDPQKMREPGLKLKWPDPIQSVTKYDTRTRFLQTKAEQQQTADSRQVTVEAFCTWRVSNPLQFFKSFSNAGDRAQDHYEKARANLSANLRSALGEISRYSMADLFTSDPKASRLDELEKRILQSLRAGSQDGSMTDYGVEVTTVGINRILLPEETTKQVFESMKADRKKIIDAIESKGDSELQSITTAATSNARRIEEFAKAYAAEIREAGNREAEQYVKQMNESPDLAVFLKKIEFLREVVARRITLVLNPSVPGMDMSTPTTSRHADGAVEISGLGNLKKADPDDAAAALKKGSTETIGKGSTDAAGTKPTLLGGRP